MVTKLKKAILLLQNGHTQSGFVLGAPGETIGEAVFNTSMTGYQEILTDPSYAGQTVCMTYPLIGNYGVNPGDVESANVYAQGMIVKEAAKTYSNFEANMSLDEYLKKNKITAIQGVDTRAVTKILRDQGAMKSIVSTKDFDFASLKKKLKNAPDIGDQDLVGRVGTGKVYKVESRKSIKSQVKEGRIAVIDCGVKTSILNNLARVFKSVVVMPHTSNYEKVMEQKPDAILFSNGPGDPEQVTSAIELAKTLIKKLENKEITIPVFGICLGHQILGIALGARIYKLKFGHHGGNHPVKDLSTGKIDITAQNHNYCLDLKKVEDKIEQTHLNLYDNTVEGIRHKKLPIFSVQFHPEAGPGPNDALYIFDIFRKVHN